MRKGVGWDKEIYTLQAFKKKENKGRNTLEGIK